MNRFNPADLWLPDHVIMGNKVSDLPATDPYVQFELHDAGVNSASMRMNLRSSALIATKAIRKMLACETQ